MSETGKKETQMIYMLDDQWSSRCGYYVTKVENIPALIKRYVKREFGCEAREIALDIRIKRASYEYYDKSGDKPKLDHGNINIIEMYPLVEEDAK